MKLRTRLEIIKDIKAKDQAKNAWSFSIRDFNDMISMVIRMNNEYVFHKDEIEKKIYEWKHDLNTIGIVQNEGDIIVTLRSIEGKSSLHEATLFYMLARSRSTRLHKMDDLSESWLEKAKSLDPNNNEVKEFYLCNVLKSVREITTILQFPTIRETDNRTAKKKLAEEYIGICRTFLDAFFDEHEKMQRILQQHSNEDPTHQKLKKWLETLQEIDALVINLLKATEEYHSSLTGVFYTSIHLEEMMTAIEKINLLNKTFQFTDDSFLTTESSSLQELDQMIGMQSVKNRVKKHYHYLQYEKQRKKLGFTMKDEVSLNMIITGNPGTGKTTLARLLAKIYYELNILPKSEVVEVDRSQLVGAYVGQTEENVKNVIKKALGGVLFIDEAYSLKREGQTGNDYGQVAVDTLVTAMTSGEFAGKFAVILAGYPEEMRQFLTSNPGLRSRFPESNYIQLLDYSNDELIEIAKRVALDNDYSFTEEALTELVYRIEKQRVDETFGNARTVKSIVMDVIFQKGASTELNDSNPLEFTILEKDDITDLNDHEPQISPEKQLSELIGLEHVKKEIKKIHHFVQIQQLRKEKGLTAVPIQLHAIFTGNPGTGKTTIASIYAGILRECGLLKRGHLIVTSRADLVAGFVGQTAIKTRKKIREALGGVLFIDEAYSLVTGGPSDFGKECIDTIVEQMTRHHENLVIVMAGYSNEMIELMRSNPGLKSRFKKFFHFPDYTPSDIVDIIHFRVKEYDYKLTDEAIFYLNEYVAANNIEGNGRFAVNFTEELLQVQAERIMEQIEVDESEFSRIIEEDIKKALLAFR
ncbi:AAA family ATPase [Bacillus salitolerans]|uniref:AAA family ATPase n=1 Tax=Bacillus salitolerans TaxID=1437434 RepID=A0ABW4LPQ8_9BACI